MLGLIQSARDLDLVQGLECRTNIAGFGLQLFGTAPAIGLWLEHCGAVEEHFPLSEAAKAWRDLPPGSPNRPYLPALVAKQAANGGTIASRAQEIWLGAYGSATGVLAVHEMASGGLWVGGGTANKQLDGLKSEAFLSAMAKKGRFSEFVGNLPVKALVDSDAGLFSAACRARVLAECA